MEEFNIIQSARRGDLDAFNQLVLDYQSQLYNQAYRLLGNIQSAEDVTQEAFLSAYKKLDQFRGGSFRIWLFRIVTNLCYDELRRLKRHPSTSIDHEFYGGPIDSTDQTKHSHRSPEDMVILIELSKALQHSLEKLPLAYRTAVVLVDIQGLDYREAAVIMGIKVGTVKSRLSRGRKKLLDDCKNLTIVIDLYQFDESPWSVSSRETYPVRTA